MADNDVVTDPVETPPVEDAIEESKVEKKAAPPVDADDADEIAQARNFYKLLKNPATAAQTIKVLANSYGIKISGDETPKQEVAKIKSIKALVKEGLGDEYSFMSERLGDILENIFERERQGTESRIHEVATTQAVREAENAFEWLKGKYEDADTYEDSIATLIDQIPIGKDTSAKEHLEMLYDIAKSRSTRKSSAKKLADKIKQNSSDPDLKLRNGKTRSVDEKSASKGRVMDLDESLSEAAKALENVRT